MSRRIYLVDHKSKKDPRKRATRMSIERQIPTLLEFRDAGKRGIALQDALAMWQNTAGSLVHRGYLQIIDNRIIITQMGIDICNSMNDRSKVYKETYSKNLSHWIKISKVKVKAVG